MCNLLILLDNKVISQIEELIRKIITFNINKRQTQERTPLAASIKVPFDELLLF